MTVTGSANSVSYEADGEDKAFTITFQFVDAEDIVCAAVDADGNVTTYSNGTDFTVTGVGGSTGTATFASAPADGLTLTFSRTMRLIQETSFRAQGHFSPALHENAFDRLTMADQDLSLQMVRHKAETSELLEAYRADLEADPDAASLDDRLVTATGGTTAVSLKSRFSSPLRVQDFGVVSGSLSTAARKTNGQNLLAALEYVFDTANDCSALYIPGGTYEFYGDEVKLELDAVGATQREVGVRIFGDGESTRLNFWSEDPGDTCIYIGPSAAAIAAGTTYLTSYEIRDLSIYAMDNALGSALYLYHADNVAVKRCRLYGSFASGANAITLDYGMALLIEECYVEGGGAGGIQVGVQGAGVTTSTTIRKCNIQSGGRSAGPAINVVWATSLLIESCVIQGNGSAANSGGGVWIGEDAGDYGYNDVIIKNNHFEDNGGHCVSAGVASYGGLPGNLIVSRDNVYYHGAYDPAGGVTPTIFNLGWVASLISDGDRFVTKTTGRYFNFNKDSGTTRKVFWNPPSDWNNNGGQMNNEGSDWPLVGTGPYSGIQRVSDVSYSGATQVVAPSPAATDIQCLELTKAMTDIQWAGFDAIVGQKVTFFLRQDATGGRLVRIYDYGKTYTTWIDYHWGTTQPPFPYDKCVISFIYDGTHWIQTEYQQWFGGGGAYDSGYAYSYGERCTSGGFMYVSDVAGYNTNTGNAPSGTATSNAYWEYERTL